MGSTRPPPIVSPMDQARILMARKDAIQAELDAQISILSANNSTLHSPLVDPQGFPRADIDVYAVRLARVRIIELRNDMDAIMNDIGKALEGVYDPQKVGNTTEGMQTESSAPSVDGIPDQTAFARVDGVAPGSPAAQAGLQREDLIVRFGTLTASSFETQPLQHLAELVASHENQSLELLVVRKENQRRTLRLTPRKGWGGRGLLGCHIVPFTSL